MIASSGKSCARVLLISTTALLAAACSGSGGYRFASIGDVPGGTADGGSGGDTASSGGSSTSGGGNGTSSGGSGGATGSSGGSGSGSGAAGAGSLLASAGNAVIGTAGLVDHATTPIGGKVPVLVPVSGTVVAVLRDTGQTVVKLGSGQRVTLASAKGIIGEVVKLDLGSRTVLSSSSGRTSLIGASLLSPANGVGSLAGVNVGNTHPVATVLQGGTGTLAHGTTSTGGVHSVVSGVTAGSGTSGGLLAPVGTLGAAVTGAAGVTTGSGNAGAGVSALLKGKK